MRSALPKAQHRLCGRAMLAHLVDSCAQVFERIVVVIGPDMDALARIAAPHAVVVQQQRLGTAHAALQAAGLFGDGDVAVLYADNPLIRPATLQALLDRRARGDAGLALLGMRPADPKRYGRVIGIDGWVDRIVEWKDLSGAEHDATLCNAGVLCAAAGDFARWLRAVAPNEQTGEYYLGDCVAHARAEGARVAVVEARYDELRGINSRAELASAEATLQGWLRAAAMDAGATLTAPETVFLSSDTVLEPDTIIGPHVVFGPGVHVASGAEVLAFSHLEGCRLLPGARVGPFARLRPGSVIGQDAHVGNFVEVKAATLGTGVKAGHLSYLGDADIGAGTNIGAGTITVNYDGGPVKHRTVVGENAFIGSNTTLVAPAQIGDGGFTTAGSVITHPVPADAMAFGRARQVTKEGRAALFRRTLKERD